MTTSVCDIFRLTSVCESFADCVASCAVWNVDVGQWEDENASPTPPPKKNKKKNDKKKKKKDAKKKKKKKKKKDAKKKEKKKEKKKKDIAAAKAAEVAAKKKQAKADAEEKAAVLKQQQQEQAEAAVAAETEFAEAVAQAAEAGAQAANAEQEAVMSSGAGYSDGLGLLSPFASEQEGGGLLSTREDKKKQKEKKKDEPPPEWAQPNQLAVKLDVLDSSSSQNRSSGRSRSSDAAAASADGDGAEGKYVDHIGKEKNAPPERVFTADGGDVPMPGVETLKLKPLPSWRLPKSYIKAPEVKTGYQDEAQIAAQSPRGTEEAHVVDYECDSTDEAWLKSKEGGSGKTVTIGELEELIDLFERSHARQKWIQPVTFESWAEKVLGEDVRTFDGPWLQPKHSKVVKEVALERCYSHWSVRRKEAGSSLVRSLRDLQRPVRANRSASPRYTEMSEKEMRAMINKEQNNAAMLRGQRTRDASGQSGGNIGAVLARRVGVGGGWTRYASQGALAKALRLDTGTVGRACRTRLATGGNRVVAGYEIRPEQYAGNGTGRRAAGGQEEGGLAVAAALERLVRQVEDGNMEEEADVSGAVGLLVDRTARPQPPPVTLHADWVRAMKTEWARERSERVARRRRQVLEAVAAMRLSRQKDGAMDLDLDAAAGSEASEAVRAELFKTATPKPKPLKAMKLEPLVTVRLPTSDAGPKDGTLWDHNDDILLCQLYGHFFRRNTGVRGRWIDVSDALGADRTQNACRHRFNLIKTRPPMAAATEEGATMRSQPQVSGGAAAAAHFVPVYEEDDDDDEEEEAGGGLLGGAVELARQGEAQ